MRVVTVVPRFPNPTEPFLVDEVCALADRGVETVVVADKVALSDDPQTRARMGGRIEVRAPRRIRRHLRLPPLWADDDADVVCFEHLYVARDNIDALMRLRAAKVVMVRGSDVRVQPVGAPEMRERVAKVLSVVDRINCMSQELADRCVELGAPAERTHVIVRGIHMDRFAFRPDRRPQDGETRIVSVGRLHWVKGYEYALHAIRMLCDAGHRISYTIVGIEESGTEEVRLAIRDLELDKIVVLTGSLPNDDIREVLAASDVYLLTSVSEGLPQATVEAMAVGLPVVVTDVGGMRELVRDGIHGRVVPSRDPTAAAAAVADLISTDGFSEMGRRGAEHVRANYDFAVHADERVAVYQELAQRRRLQKSR